VSIFADIAAKVADFIYIKDEPSLRFVITPSQNPAQLQPLY